MSAEEPAPGADIDHFRSVDSTPAAYALSRPASVANGFLVNFTAASMLLLTAAVVLFNADAAGRSRDIIVASGGDEQANVSIRLFVVAFFVVFAWMVASNGWRRSWIGLQLLGTFAVVIGTVDFGASLADAAGITTPVVGQQIVSGLIAMVTFPLIVIRNTRLPEPVEGPLTGGIRGTPGSGCRCRSFSLS